MTKKSEKPEDVLDGSVELDNLLDNLVPDEETAVSVRANTSVDVPVQYSNIKGLEDIPTYMFPLPIIKAVHPTTKGAVDASGKSVPTGHFYNTGTLESHEKITFYLLRSKPVTRKFEDKKTGAPVEEEGFAVLGAQKGSLDTFLMWVSGTSFWNFRQLLGQFRGKKVAAVWEYPIEVSTEEREGDYGRYLSVKFTPDLSSKMSEEEFNKLSELFMNFGAALNDNLTGDVEE